MPFAEINNFKIHFEIIDNVWPLDTLVFNGNLSSTRWWYPVIENLKQNTTETNRGRMILVDWRGSGRTSHPQSETELAMHLIADDFVKLAGQLKLEKINLVGHSTGGLLSLMFALKSTVKINQILLLDPVGPKGVQLQPEMLQAFEMMQADREFCATVMSSTIQGVDMQSMYFQQTVVEDAFTVAKANWKGVPQALTQVDISADLHQIVADTLVLHGENDVILSIDDSQKLAKTLPNARFQMLVGHGHSLNAENPAKFVDIARDFFTLKA